LHEDDFDILARVIAGRRAEHGFLLTAWVFLPDHWHAILAVRHPKTISLVMESIKVSSTRQINTRRKECGRLWQGWFFDRALRTVKEYHEAVEYIHGNPVRRRLVSKPEGWKWSSVYEYGFAEMVDAGQAAALRIDRLRIPADETARIWRKSRRVTKQLCATLLPGWRGGETDDVL
jgi:putative transposase